MYDRLCLTPELSLDQLGIFPNFLLGTEVFEMACFTPEPTDSLHSHSQTLKILTRFCFVFDVM